MVSIHGPAMIRAMNIATSLGMKDRVISLIWVAAWKMLTSRPTPSATSSIGAAIMRVICRACWPRVITLSGVMFAIGPKSKSQRRRPSVEEALRQRADQQIPAVDQHEQHDLERQ